MFAKYISETFNLSDEFLDRYINVKPNFGFGALSEVTYLRTYARRMENGKQEKWFDTVKRVVENEYSIQKTHIIHLDKKFDEDKAQRSAQKTFDKIFNFKFLPPGRSLFAMDKRLISEKGGCALFNCAGLSSSKIDKEYGKVFYDFFMLLSVGTGVGVSLDGAGKVNIHQPQEPELTILIEDTREGWSASVKLLADSYFIPHSNRLVFDYSKIRPAGTPLKIFGGVSGGADPLITLHKNLVKQFDENIGQALSITLLADIYNQIAKVVVAGNIRRSAVILFGEETQEYLDLKNYDVNPQRVEFSWTSNNSIFAKVGQDFTEISKRIQINGEPGLYFIENAKAYSRMGDPPDNKDYRIESGNPCLEIGLEPNELCNLSEIMLNNIESIEEFLSCCKMAFLFAKTVTLVATHSQETNEVIMRNRRVGMSVTGVTQFLHKYSLHELKRWLRLGYDKTKYYDNVYSSWFAIPLSIKITTVKPSGTISLLSGSTPGMHFPIFNYYIRRIRLPATSELIPGLKKRGYKIIENPPYEANTSIVEFPMKSDEGARTQNEVSMWEQMELSSFLQTNWSDNLISCTVTFDPKTEGKDIKHALDYLQYRIKGISFLPKTDSKYDNMPYEAITKEKYDELRMNIDDSIPLVESEEHVMQDFYCDGESCIIKS